MTSRSAQFDVQYPQVVPLPRRPRRNPAQYVYKGDPLSLREREVMDLVCTGRRRPEITAALGITPATLRTHFTHIYGKLAVNNRVAAVLVYQKMQNELWLLA